MTTQVADAAHAALATGSLWLQFTFQEVGSSPVWILQDLFQKRTERKQEVGVSAAVTPVWSLASSQLTAAGRRRFDARWKFV